MLKRFCLLRGLKCSGSGFGSRDVQGVDAFGFLEGGFVALNPKLWGLFCL